MGAKVLVGVLAGLPLAGAFIVYFLLRGKTFVALMKSTDTSFASKTDQQVFVMFLASFAFGALFLGAIAGLVYSWVGSPNSFLGLAVGLAVLMSILAVVTRTPMTVDKIFMNFAVAGVLGYLIPLFSAV
jgi:hypothetical protein